MGSRSVLSQADAHFRHGERPLEVLVRPPVDEPRALTWVPRREELVVAGRSGALHLVEPSFGTRLLEPVPADPVALLVREGWIAAVSRSGTLVVRDFPEGATRFTAQTGLLAGVSLVPWRGGVAVIGNDDQSRRVVVYTHEGTVRARARVPARTGLGATGDGHLMLARSTAAGVSVTPFGRPLPEGAPTEHTLRFGEDLTVVGIAVGGVTVWHVPGAPPLNVKLFEVCHAALSRDGEQVAMGTRVGGVAIASARVDSALRVRPPKVEGHDGPVTAMEFSTRGRWLATAAERCIVWGF